LVGSASGSVAVASVGGTDNQATNASFESPNVGSSVVRYGQGGNIDGWFVASGSVDLVGTYWQAATGSQSVDMSGAGRGGIYQDVPTVQGVTYSLAFALAGNPDCGPSVKRLAVAWEGKFLAILTFNISGHNHSNMGWTPEIFSVKAHGSLARLSFASRTSSSCGPAIDDILVQA
jgi:choice-of-anchor C domain-containing protein